jgi:hypothetical protein
MQVELEAAVIVNFVNFCGVAFVVIFYTKTVNSIDYDALDIMDKNKNNNCKLQLQSSLCRVNGYCWGVTVNLTVTAPRQGTIRFAVRKLYSYSP